MGENECNITTIEDVKIQLKSVTVPLNRPSSPRHFFERIYGDLEHNQNSKNNNNKNTTSKTTSDLKYDSPRGLSEISSSPDLYDEK